MKNFIFLLSIVFSLYACNKEKDNIQSYSDCAFGIVTSENSFSDVFKQSYVGILVAQHKIIGNIGQVSDTVFLNSEVDFTDSAAFPKTITLNYGLKNGVCADNRLRRGTIRIHITGWLCDSGSIITVNPNGYYLDNKLIQGQQKIVNNGLDKDGNMQFSVTELGTITTVRGEISWSSDENLIWNTGNSSLSNISDDSFLISGIAGGSDINDAKFGVSTITPLVINSNCRWISAGEIRFTKDSKPATINYGNGECDYYAIGKYKDKQFEISM